MIQSINEPVSVVSTTDPKTAKLKPAKFKWKNRVFLVTRLGFCYSKKQGSKLIHVFEGETDQSVYVCLHLDSHNLQWCLAKISDGSVN